MLLQVVEAAVVLLLDDCIVMVLLQVMVAEVTVILEDNQGQVQFIPVVVVEARVVGE
jgi:hypothetical protein